MGSTVKKTVGLMLIRHVFHCTVCGLTQGLPERKFMVEMRRGHVCEPLTESMRTRIEAHEILRQIKPDHPAVTAARRQALLDSHRPMVSVMTSGGPSRQVPSRTGANNPHRKG